MRGKKGRAGGPSFLGPVRGALHLAARPLPAPSSELATVCHCSSFRVLFTSRLLCCSAQAAAKPLLDDPLVTVLLSKMAAERVARSSSGSASSGAVNPGAPGGAAGSSGSKTSAPSATPSGPLAAVNAKAWAVNFTDLQLERQIGEGSFGKVHGSVSLCLNILGSGRLRACVAATGRPAAAGALLLRSLRAYRQFVQRAGYSKR